MLIFFIFPYVYIYITFRKKGICLLSRHSGVFPNERTDLIVVLDPLNLFLLVQGVFANQSGTHRVIVFNLLLTSALTWSPTLLYI